MSANLNVFSYPKENQKKKKKSKQTKSVKGYGSVSAGLASVPLIGVDALEPSLNFARE